METLGLHAKRDPERSHRPVPSKGRAELVVPRRAVPDRERQRFFLTVMVTAVLVVIAPELSVARAVSV